MVALGPALLVEVKGDVLEPRAPMGDVFIGLLLEGIAKLGL